MWDTINRVIDEELSTELDDGLVGYQSTVDVVIKIKRVGR